MYGDFLAVGDVVEGDEEGGAAIVNKFTALRNPKSTSVRSRES